MAKHRSSPKGDAAQGRQLPQEEFQVQLQDLLKQRKYRQALEEIKKIRRSIPEVEFTPPEETIWSLRGQQELQQGKLGQAESSFRHALELRAEDAYYWLAKVLLELNRLDAAIDLLRTAFEQKTLPKDYSICYLKLLLLKGDTATVEQLVVQQAKRFSAAQLHWVRGVLALREGHPETALLSLEKIKRPVTPGDVPTAWIAYAQQTLGNWNAAANALSLGSFQARRTPSSSQIVERLMTLQQVYTGTLKPSPTELRQHENREYHGAVMVIEMLQLIDQGNIHDAGHVLLKLEHHTPELNTLRRPLLILAGQQALEQRQPECAETLWQPLMAEQPFNLQLAVNMVEVLAANDSYQERQRLLTRLLKWLEQQAKQHPHDWPDAKLKPSLAKIHCYLADTWMALNRERTALGSLQQAERLCPESPEVIGRQGLALVMEEEYEEAAVMLTQALEGGCRYEEVYSQLLDCWRELGNKQAFNEARRRFGKYFGDVNVEPEIEILPWVDALSTQSYPYFSRLIQAGDRQDPALDACGIFVDAVQGFPNSGGRVSLQQAAVQQWEVLLQGLSAKEQIPVLEAIALSLLLFAKREKGIAGLTSRYLQQLFSLSAQYPEAQEAHLVVLAVKEKESQTQKIQPLLRQYLDTKPQPGTALANIQLQVRRFTKTKILLPFIDEALRRDSQNPILLLAKATTYPNNSKSYEDFRQQGFELARRLQDGKALQAFREEQAFLNACQTQEMLPDPDDFNSFDPSDVEDLLENMIRKIFGKQIPPGELERMMPELKQRLLESMPSDDPEDDDTFDIFSSPRTKKRKRGFQDL